MASEIKPVKNLAIENKQLFINNEWVNSVSGKTFPTINPATAEKIADIQEGDKADVDKAVQAAKAAFKRGSQWRSLNASCRARLLVKLADLLETDIAAFATLETMDNGKPFKDAIVDIHGAVTFLRELSKYATSICGKTIPVDGEFFCYTRLEPIGVVGAILPWNFPMVLLCNKLGHALAAGCTLVVKPAEATSLTALRFCTLLLKAGVPPGVVNVVPGYGPTVGAAMASHPDIAKISFTGSTGVGRLIMKAASESNLKRITLELGGKSPNIIFPDADLDLATEMAYQGSFVNSGQCCIAGQRLFVHEDIHDDFVRLIVERAKKRVIGDPFDPNVNAGPQINDVQQNKIVELLESGVDDGACLLMGGDKTDDKGYFVETTIFTDVKDDMRIAKEEIFGPVIMLLKFKTIDEVIERANNTHYGLAAGVFTKDLNTAVRCANELEAGTVWVNTYFQIQPHAPFGGYKMSGFGREMSEEGIKSFCEIKTVYMASPGSK